MAVENVLGGFAVKHIHPKLFLYLRCSPKLEFDFRCLPREGGLYNQDYVDILFFDIIEKRIVDFRSREEEKVKQRKPKNDHTR